MTTAGTAARTLATSRGRNPAAFLAGLPLGSFDLIMADPPTHFRVRSDKGMAKSPQAQYRTMTIDAIAALPVGHLAAADSILFLWWTWPLLLGSDDRGHRAGGAAWSPAGEVLDAWGFRYATGGAWLKRTARGKVAFGTGYRARSACEPFLLGVRGRPLNSRSERNFLEGLRREHSRKPDEAYAWAERYLPGARRLDLFSRQSRPGWTSAGDETDKFDGEKFP